MHGHFGNTPLLWASGKGHYDIVAALIKHAKLRDSELCPFKDFVNHKNKDGQNALSDAAGRNHRAIVEFLLNEDIDWSIANIHDQNALHAASYTGSQEVVSTLLAKAYQNANKEDFFKFLELP